MPSTIYNATTASPGPFVYGSSYTTPGGVAPTATYDSPASVTFTTTVANTKWLVEIDAALQWPTASGGTSSVQLQPKVDGSYVPCPAWLRVIQRSDAGYPVYASTMRGRAVVTLASAGSHTILASIINEDASTTLTRGAITITATQLS